MAAAVDLEEKLPNCQNYKEIKALISSVLFIGYNITTDNELCFQGNPLLANTTNMEDVEILFTGSI